MGGMFFRSPAKSAIMIAGSFSAAGHLAPLASLSLADGARRTGLFVTEFHSLAAAAGL